MMMMWLLISHQHVANSDQNSQEHNKSHFQISRHCCSVGLPFSMKLDRPFLVAMSVLTVCVSTHQTNYYKSYLQRLIEHGQKNGLSVVLLVYRELYHLINVQDFLLSMRGEVQYSTRRGRMLINARSPKDTPACISDEPGPTTYDLSSINTNFSISPSSVFSSLVPRGDHLQASSQPGPGCYEPKLTTVSASKFSGILPSQAPRFPTHNKENTATIAEKFVKDFSIPMKANEKVGRVIGIKETKALKARRKTQMLPSIPSAEASFGYKYNQETQRLELNSDPKIVFSGQQDRIESEGVHFQRQKSSIALNRGFKMGIRRPDHVTTVSMVSTESKQNDYGTMAGDVKKRCNPFKTSPGDGQSLGKDLVLERLKRQFQGYVPEGMTIQELQELKNNHKHQLSLTSNLHTTSKECFLSTQTRFNDTQPGKSIKEPQKQQNTLSLGAKDPSSRAVVEPKQKTSGACEPFAKGQYRWKQNTKQMIGPGSYDAPLRHPSRRTLLNQKQARFKVSQKDEAPGPGTYKTECFQKQRKLQQFKRCGRKAGNNNQQNNTMESLYQNVGKTLTVIEKSQRGHSHQKVRVKQKHEREENCFSLRKKLEKTLGSVEDTWKSKQRGPAETIPKHQHMYSYQAPPEGPSGPAPGYYQVRTQMGSTTFNVTACKPSKNPN